MPRPILVLGSGPDLAANWRRWAEAHPGALTLVPRLPVAAALRARDPGQTRPPRIRMVESWLWAHLPPDVVPPPAGIDAVLAESLPAALKRRLSPVPGLWPNMLATLWAGRREGLDDRAYRRLGGPWPDLARWLEGSLPARIFDPARVYHYAAQEGLETDASEPLAFFQAGLLEGAAFPWMRRLAESRRLILFADPRASSPRLLARLRRLEPDTVRCGRGDRPKATVLAVESAPGYAAGAARAVVAEMGGEGPWFVVDDPLGFGRDLVGARPHPEARTRAAWLRFWRMSQKTATRVEAIDWLSAQKIRIDPASRRTLWRQGRRWKALLAAQGEAEEAIGWAREWGRAFLSAETFAAAADLAEEALGRQHLLTGAWIVRLSGWRALAEGGLRPDPTMLEALATAADPPAEPDLPLVSPEVVPSLAGGTWVYLGADEPSPPPPALALVPPSVARRLGLLRRAEVGEGLARTLERVADRVLYGVGIRSTFRPEAPRVGWAEGAEPAPPGPIAEWYRAHRSPSEYSAYSGWVAPVMDPLSTSPSGLEQFGRCPLAFFYARVLRVGEPDADETSVSPSATLTGTWIHRALEIGAEQGFRNGDEPAVAISWIQAAIADDPPGPEVSPAVMASVVEGLGQELAEAQWRHPDLFQDVHGEVEVRLDFSCRGAELQSRLDRVDALPDGRLRIVDYKTGRLKDPDDLRPDNLQLALYREGLARNRSLSPGMISAELLGVRAKNGYARRALSPKAAERLGALVDGIVQRVRAGRFHPIPTGDPAPCRTCAFRLACPDRIQDEARVLGASDPPYRALWDVGEEAGDD